MQKVGLVLARNEGLPKAMTDFQITYKCIVEQKVKVPEEQHNIFMIVMVKLLASIGYENKYHDRKNRTYCCYVV